MVASAALTQEAAPTLVATILPADPNNLPNLTLDLQYESESKVLRWNHVTRSIELVLDFHSLDGNGSYRNFVYRKDKLFRVTGEGFTESNLYGAYTWEVVDLKSGAVNVLRSFDTGFGKEFAYAPSISPDGNWFVYCWADWSKGAEFTNHTMYLLSTTPPFTTTVLGPCDRGSQAIWSDNNETLLWTNSDGIWSAAPPSAARLIFRYPDEGPKLTIREWWPRWSSSGRYVIAYSPGAIEGGSLTVLDTQTGHIAGIPDTWEYGIPGARVGWIKNDRLVVLKPGDLTASKSFVAVGRIWKMDPSQDGLLVMEQSFPINDIDPAFLPFAPAETSTGLLVFAVFPVPDVSSLSSRQWDGGIYSFDPNSQELKKLNVLPNYVEEMLDESQLVWLPDESGVMITNWIVTGKQFIYIPSNGGLLYDLAPVVSDKARNFVWLP